MTTQLLRRISSMNNLTKRLDLEQSKKSKFSTSTTSPVLRDTFGRHHNYLRISLTERCNLRCTYCMPEEGIELSPKSHLLTTKETLQLAHLFINEGVTKIRFTGGEPTIHPDLADVIKSISERKIGIRGDEMRGIGELTTQSIRSRYPYFKGVDTIGITTNGLTLTVGNRLQKYVAAGLTNINISLDTLDPLRFPIITRRQGFKKVYDSIILSLELGLVTKVNCVIQRGINDDEVYALAKLAKDMPLQVRFIEYMPFDGNKWNQKKVISMFEMIDLINIGLQHDFEGGFERGFERGFSSESEDVGKKNLNMERNIHTTIPSPIPKLQRSSHLDDKDKVARIYSIPGYKGTIGFISSMTNSFCSSCNRLRITADGNIKVCLFGQEEVSLRDLLRNTSSVCDNNGLDISDISDVISPKNTQCITPNSANWQSLLDEISSDTYQHLQSTIQKAVYNKKEAHDEPEKLKETLNRPMIKIGG